VARLGLGWVRCPEEDPERRPEAAALGPGRHPEREEGQGEVDRHRHRPAMRSERPESHPEHAHHRGLRWAQNRRHRP